MIVYIQSKFILQELLIMAAFQTVYVPAGVPTFHLESAGKEFEKSIALLRSIDPDVVVPEEMLLSIDALDKFLSPLSPDLIIFQNITFANSAYMSDVLRRFNCPVVLWTLAEPVIDGGRLRLNSLTGAYSAATALDAFGRPFEYVFGSPECERVGKKLAAFIAAGKLRHQMRSLRMAAIGHTPQGFGFGRALDSELLSFFGVTLESIEARELIDIAKGYTDEEVLPYVEKTCACTVGLDKTPEHNVKDHARLLKAYSDYVEKNNIGALASRCWPDFFTAFGTPVCTVLSMLNDKGVAAACEADMYGALSMWMGMQLSGEPVYFGDPVSLNEEESTITFWHCGAAACSLAREDTGAVVGVHPNRKIGPAMDFGCKPAPEATVFRIGRKADGSFRFFLLGGEILDKPKQFIGTSVVVKTERNSREVVEDTVKACFEPHFVVIRGDHKEALTALATMLGMEVCNF